MDVSPSELGPLFEIRSGVVTPDTAAEQFLLGNSNRVTLSLSLATTVHVSVSNILSNATADQVFHIGVESPVIITFRDFGPLVGLPWFASGGITLPPLLFTEIIYRPRKLR